MRIQFKKNLIYLSLLTCILFLFSNCSIQKRTYKKGYFVQWNFNNKINTSKNVHHLEAKTSENQDTLELVSHENEISLNTETSTGSVYKSDEKDFIELEKTNTVSSNKGAAEIKAKSNPKIFIVKKYKSSDEIEKERKNQDYGTRVHIILTTALFSSLLGLIFMIRALSTNYINMAMIPGMLFSLAGIILLIVSFLMFVNWLVKREKNKEKASVIIRKKYRIFALIDLGLVLSYLTLLYFADQLL